LTEGILTNDPQEGIITLEERLELAEIRTEDGVIVHAGDRVYNYYDMEPGHIESGSHSLMINGGDIWFDFKADNGRVSILNGQRICSIEFAKRRGFRGV